jgi:hypothetical protein
LFGDAAGVWWIGLEHEDVSAFRNRTDVNLPG